MNVCFVTSEAVPYAKTGGLGDVSGSLPKALAALGCRVKVIMPLYNSIDTMEHQLSFSSDLGRMTVGIGGREVPFHGWHGYLPDSEVEVHFIESSSYYHRPGLYTADWDEDERFILLQRAAFHIMQRYHWSPDILHCNDWHTGLMPVYLRRSYGWDTLFSKAASVLTLHNVGYQGRFGEDALLRSGVPRDLYYPGGPAEFRGSFSFLKAGISFADVITTVSETHALEIQTPEFGMGMESVLQSRAHDVFGVVNGIDTEVWNPGKDPLIVRNYTHRSLARKKENKKALLAEFGLAYSSDMPVVGLVSRLTPQKGIELIMPVFERLMSLPIQMIFLGSGEAHYESFLATAQQRYPDRVGLYLGYNEGLSHRITAGSDMVLMPSRYEPCGMNQMFGLLYGSAPIVRRTGGLADTVRDFHEFEGEGNGFSFQNFSSEALYQTIRRAVSVFADKEAWFSMIGHGMREDFSWERSARRYIELYERGLAKVGWLEVDSRS
jgi:starch synthase